MEEFKTCPPLANALGDAIKQLPVLDLGEREGPTGYIDFILAEEMKHPIMKGKDKYGRPFIAIKVKCSGNRKYDAVGTFFQRYSDECENWAYGTAYDVTTGAIYNDSRVRVWDYVKLEDRLRGLVTGGKIQSIPLVGGDVPMIVKLA